MLENDNFLVGTGDDLEQAVKRRYGEHASVKSSREKSISELKVRDLTVEELFVVLRYLRLIA